MVESEARTRAMSVVRVAEPGPLAWVIGDDACA